MNARLIDGKKLSNQIKEDISVQVQQLRNKNITPGLAVVLVGSDPASQVYVNNKAAACEAVGIYSQVIELSKDITQDQLLKTINDLNQNDKIHGILVQLPLPKHLDSSLVIQAISPHKDVDGFHISNVGLLTTGTPLFKPCTPYGIMKMLESENVSLWGAEVVIVGASNIVGKPMAMLMLAQGATITICNSKTKDLKSHTKRADILVVATGKPNMVTGDMVKPGAVVIDVGINRNSDGKLCGDVEFESASKVAGAITPVPGGVGPMTIAMLLCNTLQAAQN